MGFEREYWAAVERFLLDASILPVPAAPTQSDNETGPR
jgi:hypothetical protein